MLFRKPGDKGKGYAMLTSHYEMEIEKDKQQIPRASQNLIAWLNSFKIYLNSRIFDKTDFNADKCLTNTKIMIDLINS